MDNVVTSLTLLTLHVPSYAPHSSQLRFDNGKDDECGLDKEHPCGPVTSNIKEKGGGEANHAMIPSEPPSSTTQLPNFLPRTP